MLVHNQSTQPFTLSTGINVQTGLETYVGVSRLFSTKLSSPYSNCISDLNSNNIISQKLFGYMKSLNVSYYDETFCLKICDQDKLIDKCGCCDITTPSIRGAVYCANNTQIDCLNKFYINATNSSDLIAQCQLACPPQCFNIDYNLVSSTAHFPTYKYVKILQSDNSTAKFFPQNVSDSDILDFAYGGLLKLIVNYDENYYTTIVENPSSTVNDLFGNLGGQFGLFIGLSILSFMEIIDLFIAIFIILFDHRKNRTEIKVFTSKTS